MNVRRVPELLGPAALVLGAAFLGLGVSTSLQTYFLDTLVKVSIVVALYVFIGNSGVLSFGHVAFVALGVWTAGVLTVPESQKNAIMPGLAHFLLHTNVGNVASRKVIEANGGRLWQASDGVMRFWVPSRPADTAPTMSIPLGTTFAERGAARQVG